MGKYFRLLLVSWIAIPSFASDSNPTRCEKTLDHRTIFERSTRSDLRERIARAQAKLMDASKANLGNAWDMADQLSIAMGLGFRPTSGSLEREFPQFAKLALPSLVLSPVAQDHLKRLLGMSSARPAEREKVGFARRYQLRNYLQTLKEVSARKPIESRSIKTLLRVASALGDTDAEEVWLRHCLSTGEIESIVTWSSEWKGSDSRIEAALFLLAASGVYASAGDASDAGERLSWGQEAALTDAIHALGRLWETDATATRARDILLHLFSSLDGSDETLSHETLPGRQLEAAILAAKYLFRGQEAPSRIRDALLDYTKQITWAWKTDPDKATSHRVHDVIEHLHQIGAKAALEVVGDFLDQESLNHYRREKGVLRGFESNRRFDRSEAALAFFYAGAEEKFIRTMERIANQILDQRGAEHQQGSAVMEATQIAVILAMGKRTERLSKWKQLAVEGRRLGVEAMRIPGYPWCGYGMDIETLQLRWRRLIEQIDDVLQKRPGAWGAEGEEEMAKSGGSPKLENYQRRLAGLEKQGLAWIKEERARSNAESRARDLRSAQVIGLRDSGRAAYHYRRTLDVNAMIEGGDSLFQGEKWRDALECYLYALMLADEG